MNRRLAWHRGPGRKVKEGAWVVLLTYSFSHWLDCPQTEEAKTGQA